MPDLFNPDAEDFEWHDFVRLVGAWAHCVVTAHEAPQMMIGAELFVACDDLAYNEEFASRLERVIVEKTGRELKLDVHDALGVFRAVLAVVEEIEGERSIEAGRAMDGGGR